MAPVIKILEKSSQVDSLVCVTSQHREMVAPLIRFFGIRCDYDLNVMRHDQALHEVSAAVLHGLASILEKAHPNWVLVQGDTSTALAAALASYYARISIGHVEAGLRTGDKYNPFPEEINRRLTDVLSDIHFAPTERAKQNLLSEGVLDSSIVVTGNTVIDSLQLTLHKLQKDGSSEQQMEELFVQSLGIPVTDKRILLVTGHRRESFGLELEGICMGYAWD